MVLLQLKYHLDRLYSSTHTQFCQILFVDTLVNLFFLYLYLSYESKIGLCIQRFAEEVAVVKGVDEG